MSSAYLYVGSIIHVNDKVHAFSFWYHVRTKHGLNLSFNSSKLGNLHQVLCVCVCVFRKCVKRQDKQLMWVNVYQMNACILRKKTVCKPKWQMIVCNCLMICPILCLKAPFNQISDRINRIHDCEVCSIHAKRYNKRISM